MWGRLLCLLTWLFQSQGQYGGYYQQYGGQQQQETEQVKIDPYEVLGLSNDATPAQIKKAYRVMSLKYHPDRNKAADAQEKMQQVSTAYEMIGDPDQKVIFDEFGSGEQYYSKWQYEMANKQKGRANSKKDFYTHAEDIQTLETTNFYKFLKNGKPVIVEFYAPWCTHCQTMVGEYKKLAILLEESVSLGAVNCERVPAVCNQQGVRSYPTLRLMMPKEGSKQMDMEDYNGEHKAEDMYSWVDMQLNPSLITLGSDFDQVVSQSDDVWLIDFSAGQWCGPCTMLKGQMRETAHAMKGVAKIGIINCDDQQEICGKLGIQYYPQIRLFRKGVTEESGRLLEANDHFPSNNILTLFAAMFDVLNPPKEETPQTEDFDSEEVDEDEEHVHSEL